MWLALVGLAAGVGVTVYKMIATSTITPIARYLETWALGGLIVGAICGLVGLVAWTVSAKRGWSRRARIVVGSIASAVVPAVATLLLVPITESLLLLVIAGVTVMCVVAGATAAAIGWSERPPISG